MKGYNCYKPIPILVDNFYVPVLISETRTKSSDYLACISLTMSFLLKENNKSESSLENDQEKDKESANSTDEKRLQGNSFAYRSERDTWQVVGRGQRCTPQREVGKNYTS